MVNEINKNVTGILNYCFLPFITFLSKTNEILISNYYLPCCLPDISTFNAQLKFTAMKKLAIAVSSLLMFNFSLPKPMHRKLMLY
jgi:hypothetical protein